jgi:hypothetical protein
MLYNDVPKSERTRERVTEKEGERKKKRESTRERERGTSFYILSFFNFFLFLPTMLR